MVDALVSIEYGMKVFGHCDSKSYAEYDWTNQGIQSHAMQHIISSEVNGDHVLSFEKVIVQEQEVHKKLKIFQFLILFFNYLIICLIF
ncbi:unnamed protein product [Sphagnum troendelagicum]|uniref:Uncharacterized protein n=1 Tax=Sphagnum troendelagicum TaxID=128251 RepID=A0ABP0TW49_9BRYO